MDPVSAIVTAVQIARAVQAQLALMAKNRADCADLGARMEGLINAIEACKENKYFLDINGALLNRLLDDMQRAKELITLLAQAEGGGSSKKALARNFFGAGDDRAQLQELNRRITQHVTDLQPGIAAANARATSEGIDDVKAKLDRTTVMLEALQGLLLAASVTDAVHGPGQGRGGGRRKGKGKGSKAMRVRRKQQGSGSGAMPAGSYQNDDGEEDEDDEDEDEDDEADEGVELQSGPGRPASSHPTSTTTTAAPPSPLGPKLGRALEVAAHQFVFGCFMVGIALMHTAASYRATVLALSPLVPAGVMVLIQAMVLVHARSKMEAGHRQSIALLLRMLLVRSLVPLQLYATPTLGALAALAGEAFLGRPVGAGGDVGDDFHTGILGVGVGTLVFAASYLASAR